MKNPQGRLAERRLLRLILICRLLAMKWSGPVTSVRSSWCSAKCMIQTSLPDFVFEQIPFHLSPAQRWAARRCILKRSSLALLRQPGRHHQALRVSRRQPTFVRFHENSESTRKWSEQRGDLEQIGLQSERRHFDSGCPVNGSSLRCICPSVRASAAVPRANDGDGGEARIALDVTIGLILRLINLAQCRRKSVARF